LAGARVQKRGRLFKESVFGWKPISLATVAVPKSQQHSRQDPCSLVRPTVFALAPVRLPPCSVTCLIKAARLPERSPSRPEATVADSSVGADVTSLTRIPCGSTTVCQTHDIPTPTVSYSPLIGSMHLCTSARLWLAKERLQSCLLACRNVARAQNPLPNC
jgi:hypothetical protein